MIKTSASTSASVSARPSLRPPYGEGGMLPALPSISLDLRFRNGNRQGFMYAYLFEVEYDASGLIRLTFGDVGVEVRGRNLTELYERLLVHGIGYIQESAMASATPAVDPFVEAITIRKRKEE